MKNLWLRVSKKWLVNEQDGEIKEMFNAYSLLLTINEHAMQLNRAIDECRRAY